jgi:YesN/AraC family two-component response regulator
MRAFLPMAHVHRGLSGYDEFEYTRKSIQIKIADYTCSKPVSAAEFTAVLVRAKKALDEAHLRHNNVQVMNRIFSDSLPSSAKQLLCSLIPAASME